MVEQLATFVVSAKYEHLSEQARKQTKIRILDALGCAIGALDAEPIKAILEVAATWNSDIIVMGSRGLGRLQGALLGSNSQKVVSHAACPVLVVR